MSHLQKNTESNQPENLTGKVEGLAEEWKDVADTDGQYQVSNLGRVRSNKWGRVAILRNNLVGCGYYRMSISTKMGVRYLYVHRMVMESFVGMNPLKNVVNHKDGNKLNNRLDNLEWVTHGENVRHGLMLAINKGSPPKNNFKKLSAESVRRIFNSTKSARELAKKYGIRASYVSKIKKGLVRGMATGGVCGKNPPSPINESEWILCA